MQKPLMKFSMSKIDVDCLHQVVTQKTVRIVQLLNDSHDTKSEGNRGSPLNSCKEFSSEIWRHHNQVTSSGKQPRVITNKKNNEIETITISECEDLQETLIFSKKKLSTVASDLGWGSDEDDKEITLKEDEEKDVEIIETRSYPRRVSLEREWSPLAEAKEFPFMKLSEVKASENDLENDVKCDYLYSLLEPELDKSEKAHPNFQDVFLLETPSETLVNVCEKPVRFYEKKSTKSVEEERSTLAVDSEPPFCVIKEVVGNAKETFNNEDGLKVQEEPVVITPQKTRDITKIKGWRRKQFLVEKRTTVEFYSYDRGSEKKKIRLVDLKDQTQSEPGNVENAFVCDSLDDFLNNEAELNINYEIPHLYAEVGIKLTSEDLVSRPNLSEEDFKEVGSRYCVKLPSTEDLTSPYHVSDAQTKRHGEEREQTPYKMLKIDTNKRKLVKIESKSDSVMGGSIVPKSVSILKSPEQRLQLKNIKENLVKLGGKRPVLGSNQFVSRKLLGLVVYPGLSRPLHPVVQRHLHKLRSFRTKIDENWATFAVSALQINRENQCLNRRILPVYCMKMLDRKREQSSVEQEVKDVVNCLLDSVCDRKNINKSVTKKTAELNPTIREEYSEKKHRLRSMEKKCTRKCKVVLNKITAKSNAKIWCMEHECYSCQPCGYDHIADSKEPATSTLPTEKNLKVLATDISVVEIGNETEDADLVPMGEPIENHLSLPYVTTHFSFNLFDEKLTNALKQKLRDITFGDENHINVDKLKTLVADKLELVKLNILKQSFFSGTIFLWYWKPEFQSDRCRAFLSFSEVPPQLNAINIKKNQMVLEGLPKIITEIVSSDKRFENDEYGILHCNGVIWEIHGSLKLSENKNVSNNEDWVHCDDETDMEVEQVVIPVPLQEMNHIRVLATKILGVREAKWLVLDMSQNFSDMIVNVDARKVKASRTHLLSMIQSKFFGYLVIKKRKGRLHGLYVSEKLFPFILMGPYYTFEKCMVSLKIDSKKIPFAYNRLEKIDKGHSLKYFINSVISASQESKRLDGLWLYDKQGLENVCYLETLLRNVDQMQPNSFYTVETEHSYATRILNGSLHNTADIVPSSTKFPSTCPNTLVYLYFDIFDLGYVTGVLQPDNSVLICHPLAPNVRMKSFHVGNVFINLLKRRIKFFPDNFKIKWFITKEKDELQGRTPFNKYVLGGAHILCKQGLLSMFELDDSKINALKLKKNEVLKAVYESERVQEVIALKTMSSLVAEDSSKNLSMEQVLTMSVEVIQQLQKTHTKLMATKCLENYRRFELLRKYENLINDKKESFGKESKKWQQINSKFMEAVDDIKKREENLYSVSTCTSRTNIHLAPVAADEYEANKLEDKIVEVYKSMRKSENLMNVVEFKQILTKLNTISNNIKLMNNIYWLKLKKQLKRDFNIRLNDPPDLSSRTKVNDEKSGNNRKENEKKTGFIKLDSLALFSEIKDTGRTNDRKNSSFKMRKGRFGSVKDSKLNDKTLPQMKANFSFNVDKGFVIIREGKKKYAVVTR